MAVRRILATTVALSALAGFDMGQEVPGGSPALDLVTLNRGLCGDGSALQERRAFFVRMAQAYAAEQGAAPGDGAVEVLPETLERLHYPITTASPEAQEWFDRGVAYTVGFNHAEAVKAFRQGRVVDPACAMCAWGEAFALGSNINAPFDPEIGEDAMAAAAAASNNADGASDAEKALIEAMAVRYAKGEDGGIVEDAMAFAEAMDKAARAHPDDNFIAVVAAEANMDTQPWDYWEPGGRTPKGRGARTIELLESVIARNPDYPPAIHLYIHATEASTDPWRAEAHADRLAALAPDLGHIVHMPSHVYYRIGEWKKSLDINYEAVAADEAFLKKAADPSLIYAYGYYPHNVHFALTSALMAGHGEVSAEMAGKLQQALPVAVTSPAPVLEIIKAAPHYVDARFGDMETVLAADKPATDDPFLLSAWHYARGEKLALAGRSDEALAEAAAIEALASRQEIADLLEAFVPGPQVLSISALTIRARVAAMNEDYARAVSLMEEAVAVQDAIPYMEPPFWYYPARQTLGAYLLLDGQADRAEQVFLAALLDSPNNAWVLHGLSEVYRARGEVRSARHAERLFRDAWLGDMKDRPDLVAL